MTVKTEYVSDHVAVVEFSQPPHNFFDPELLWNILEAYQAMANDRRTRAIVLASEGRHFCAGANFRKEALDPGAPPPLVRPHLYAIATMIFEQPLPVVAALQGRVVGGGLGLAMSADFRIAAPETRIAANFARIGLHHGFGLSVTLPASVGRQKALELLYTGREVEGEEALRIGLVDRLGDQQLLREAAIEMANELAQSAPLAVRSIRQTMRAKMIEDVGAAVERELGEQAWLRETHDFKIGVQAKRGEQPRFEGN